MTSLKYFVLLSDFISTRGNRPLLITISRCASQTQHQTRSERHDSSLKDSVDNQELKSNQSWDLFRNLSSFRWSPSSAKAVESKDVPKEVKKLEKFEGWADDEAVKKSDSEILKNNIQAAAMKVNSTPVVEVSDSFGDQILSKLLDANSVISKVAQLNILNEHLARDNTILSLDQKKILVKHLVASKKDFPKRRYHESVRCTLNLLGLPEKPKGAGIKILCIDGGGTRGLAPLEMLLWLERKCQEKKLITPDNPDTSQSFLSQFDLICGVSTGSIVTFMTGVAGLSFEKSIKLYRKMASEIFQRNSFWSVSSTLAGNSWYDTDKWTRHLQSYAKSFDPVYTAAKNPNSPMICVVSVVSNREILRPFVFRTYGFTHVSKSRYLGGAAAENWEVLRASTAAPFYFDPVRYGDMVLQDGGILLNNPTALAVHEARALWPDEELQLVLSMGTGLQNSIPKEAVPTKQAKAQSQAKGKNEKVKTEYFKTFNHFIDTVTNTEVVHTTLKDLLPRGTYYRFNPRLNDSFVLDEFRAEKLDDLRNQTLQYMAGQSDRVDKFVQALSKKRSTKAKLKDLWQLKVENMFSK